MARNARRSDTDFGFRRVPLGDKQALVDDVFHSVARRYDLMNDLMSGGPASRLEGGAGHGGQSAAEARSRAFALLDLAGGTGDVAFRVAEAGGPGTHVTVADINAEMLAVGRERAAKAKRDIEFVEANAEALPFPDKSFDAVTIAFGIRNVPRIDVALARSPSRAEDRRAFPLPGILLGRCAGPRPALRSLFVQRHPGGRPRGDRRRRGLSLSGRIDPQISAARSIRRHDARRGLPPRLVRAR